MIWLFLFSGSLLFIAIAIKYSTKTTGFPLSKYKYNRQFTLMSIDPASMSSINIPHNSVSILKSKDSTPTDSQEVININSISDDKGGGGQVFVCTNKWCREKGSDATMATFSFLTPHTIPVVGVNCLGRCNKGPNCRILTPKGAFQEASMVRSVEKVVELLQQYLNLNINVTSADVLRLNYEGNVFLRNGQVDLAIDCYNKALELGDKEQEGVLLLMRGSALLQRAYDYRIRYRDVLSLAEEVLPKIETLMLLLMVLPLPAISPAMCVRDANFQVQLSLGVLLQIGTIYSSFEGATLSAWNEAKQRWPDWTSASVTSGGQLLARGCFYWALYEQALLRSLQDLLSATVILPGFAQAWRRAGEALSEMRLLSSAVEYYQVAIRLDSSLTDVLRPAMERIKIMEKVTEKSSSRGLSAEAFLSMLDE